MAETPAALPGEIYLKWRGSLWHLAPPWVKVGKSVAQDIPITAEKTYLECGSDAPAVALLDDKAPLDSELCMHCKKRREKRKARPDKPERKRKLHAVKN